jgi:NaMN:DMB phosphoribosyltransferase
MQAVVAGIASSAAKRIRVFLAGGSQMLAIWGLLKALALPQAQLERITIMTTGWVAFDKSAGVQKLAQIMNAPMAAACPNFWNSRHPGLQAYEEGNVKEGVGAGACMCLAHLYGFTARDIQSAIDTCYDELLAKSFR